MAKKTSKKTASLKAAEASDKQTMRLVINTDGRIVFADAAVVELFGRRALTGHLAEKIITPMAQIPQNSSQKDRVKQALSPFFIEGEKQVSVRRNETEAFVLNSHTDVVTASTGEEFAVLTLGSDTEKHDIKDKDAFSFLEKLIRRDKIHRPTFKWGQQAHDVVEVKSRLAEDPAHKDLLALRHFLNLSDDLFGVARLDGFIFYRTTPSFQSVLGYSEAEMAEIPFLNIVHDKDKQEIAALLMRLIDPKNNNSASETQDTPSITFECRMTDKNKQDKWVKWTMKYVEGEIYANGRNITHEKSNQVNLKFSQQQLSEAQAIAKLGHWRWEIGDSDYEWSDQIYDIFGVTRQRFRPSFKNVNNMIHKRDLARLIQQFERAVLEKKDYQLQFRLTRPDGEVRCARCEGKCELDQAGNVRALFGIIQDITEQTTTERALRQAKEAAEAAYKAKSRFLANMSHELRTPLNAIIGFSEMIQRQLLGPVGNDRYIDYVKGIRESGEHLLDLITDILDMSKIEAGKYKLHPEELTLSKVTRLVTHMIEGKAEEGRVYLSCKTEPDTLKIEADRRALMQILLNVLSNAIKFTRAGGKVELSCHIDPKDENNIILQITDTGVGIPRMKLQRITRPFEQVANALTRDHEGTGLGLSITKSLVELHGGNLRIDSQVGVGTIVSIIMPIKAQIREDDGDDSYDEDMIEFDDSVIERDAEATRPIFRQMQDSETAADS